MSVKIITMNTRKPGTLGYFFTTALLVASVSQSSDYCLAAPVAKKASDIDTAEMLSKAGKVELAKTLLERILKKDPNNAHAWYLLGTVHEDMTIMEGSSKVARECYLKCLAITPDDSMALRKMGELAGIDGNWKEQIVYCNRALAVRNPSSLAYKSLAIAKSNLHRDKEALVDYEKFLAAEKIRLQSPKALDEYATFLENAGHYDKAIEILATLETVNHKPSIPVRRAKCFLKAGKPAECLAIMAKMIAREPEDETLYADRARMYITMGKNQEALKDWNKVLQLEPNSKYYEERAALLDKLGDPLKAKADRQTARSLN